MDISIPGVSTIFVTLIGAALIGLGSGARRVFGEWLHPSVLYPLCWGGALLTIVAALPLGFYPVHPAAAALFFAGALIFAFGASAGGRLASATGGRAFADPFDHLNYPALVGWCLVLHAILLPLWWREVTAIADSTDLVTVGFQVRYKTVLGEATLGSLVGNYLVLGLILVPVLAMGAFRHRLPFWMALAASAPWLFANLIANGRAGLVQLLIAVAYLRATEPTPIPPRIWALGLFIFVGIFAGGVVLVSKGNTTIDLPLVEVVQGVMTNLLDYLMQGPILFSRYLTDEVRVVSSWDALIIPCRLLHQAFGVCTPGELHQEFSDFGASDRIGNVYSIYFSILPKYGPFGLVVLLGLYGAWTAFHHGRHRQRVSIGHSLVAAYLVAAIPLSIFADQFAPNLNFLLKAAVVSVVLQRVLRRPEPLPSVRPGVPPP